jgi:type IV secretory pathway TraG/TraD family ATPase VirD4
MSVTSGRLDSAGTWPNAKPVWTLSALVLAVVTAIGVGQYRYSQALRPLQRLYLVPYVRSAVAGAVGFTIAGRYRFLTFVDTRGPRVLALDDRDVEPADDRDDPTWKLSVSALAGGASRLAWQDASYDHAKLHALLRHWVYADQSPTDLAAPALWSAVGVGFVGLLVAIPKDIARTRARRQGRRLKGPEFVTVRQFNRRMRAAGLGWMQASGGVARLCSSCHMLRIPRAMESSHILLMGDTGTGKSILIRQVLRQLDARGEIAIVYDPALEFTPEFYEPARGDVILNPLDARSPYWTPADEIRRDAEALTLATSLFPDKPYENTFFTDGSRRIFADLLKQSPSPQELTRWLRDSEELDRRLAGTAYAAFIDRQAPQQRSGILASLNMVADALNLLPAERDTTRRWSATAWAAQRRGWLFLTSTPETRESLKPLLSLWLDLLVVRLLNQGQPGTTSVWFVLDELASLQRLPQLHTAVTENRKSKNPLLLGFQGRSQLETCYGHDAEAMLAQPATKIFLRTNEAHAAKWISDTIGQIEVERLQESRSKGHGRQQSYGLERHVEPLIMPSEITGLPDLTGYLKLGNLVVRLRVPYLKAEARQPRFVERPTHRRPDPTQPLDPPASSGGHVHQIPGRPVAGAEVTHDLLFR